MESIQDSASVSYVENLKQTHTPANIKNSIRNIGDFHFNLLFPLALYNYVHLLDWFIRIGVAVKMPLGTPASQIRVSGCEFPALLQIQASY